MRFAWLVLLAIPILASAQREEGKGGPVADIPRLLRPLGYKVEIGLQGNLLRIAQGDREATLYFPGCKRSEVIWFSRTYKLDHHVPREKLSAWCERSAPGLDASSDLDGTIRLSGSEFGDATDWDISLQSFFRQTRLLEREMLQPEAWNPAHEFRLRQKSQPKAKLDEAIRVDHVTRGDAEFLFEQWQSSREKNVEFKRRPFSE